MKLVNAFKSVAAIVGVLALGFPNTADAATTVTNTFTVTATVTATCSIPSG